MTGKHFNFHRRWAVDLAARTATHDSGLVVRFTPAPGVPGAWDGGVDETNAAATLAILSAQHGPGNAAAMLPRLMREAGEVFSRARSKPRLL